MAYEGNRAMRKEKERCMLCGELLADYATYPYNRQGAFPHWYHVACVQRTIRWFVENSYLIDWQTLTVMDMFNRQAINGWGENFIEAKK